MSNNNNDDYLVSNINNDGEVRKISASAPEIKEIKIQTESKNVDDDRQAGAKTNTVNERLIAEAKAAAVSELQPRTNFGGRFKGSFRYNKADLTDEQREEALAKARDLNGVNPIVTLLGSFFALGAGFLIWNVTQWLGDLFLSHPISADAPYAFARAASVVRNLVMGISSLASAFFAVTGLGIFALGVRVSYGVFTGELDPTPIKKSTFSKLNDEEAVLPNVWDLMMNKKPGRKRGRKDSNNSGDNPFGL